MKVRVDPLANVVGRYEAGDGGDRTLLLGSHIDTVRNAGRFDGPLGVVTAIEVVKAAFKAGKRFPFAIEVIAFGDEEGVRFASTLGGSRALAGTFDPKALDESAKTACRAARRWRRSAAIRRASPKRHARRTAWSAMSKCTSSRGRSGKRGPAARRRHRHRGVTRAAVEVDGVAGHAGTVPMPMRHDALAAAAEMLLAIEEQARARSNLVATVGKLEVPGSAPNTIPGRVRFTLDIRSPSDPERIKAVADIKDAIAAIAEAPRRDAALDPRSRGLGRRLRRRAVGSTRRRGRSLRRDAAADAVGRRPRRHGVRPYHSVRHAVRALPRRGEPQPGRIRLGGRYRHRRARSLDFHRQDRIMTRLRITAGPYQFEARLEEEAAPKTCAKFLTLLPYRQQIIHVRWSGEGCWIPLGDVDFGLGYDASPSAAGPVVAAVDRLVQCQKR